MKTRSKLSATIIITSLAAVPLVRAAVIANGLIGYWAGDGNAADTSATANNGTFSGSYVPGVFGSAFDLSGASVAIPDAPAYSFGPNFSLAFWFNRNAAAPYGVFVGQDNGGGGQLKWFFDYGYTGGQFDFHVNGSSYAFLPSNPLSFPDGWNHAAMVKSGDLYSFYLNGAPIGTQTFGGAFPDPSAPLEFGNAEGIRYGGLIDEVVLYDRALSGTEVSFIATVPELSVTMFGLLGLTCVAFKRSRNSSNG